MRMSSATEPFGANPKIVTMRWRCVQVPVAAASSASSDASSTAGVHRSTSSDSSFSWVVTTASCQPDQCVPAPVDASPKLMDVVEFAARGSRELLAAPLSLRRCPMVMAARRPFSTLPRRNQNVTPWLVSRRTRNQSYVVAAADLNHRGVMLNRSQLGRPERRARALRRGSRLRRCMGAGPKTPGGHPERVLLGRRRRRTP